MTAEIPPVIANLVDWPRSEFDLARRWTPSDVIAGSYLFRVKYKDALDNKVCHRSNALGNNKHDCIFSQTVQANGLSRRIQQLVPHVLHRESRGVQQRHANGGLAANLRAKSPSRI